MAYQMDVLIKWGRKERRSIKRIYTKTWVLGGWRRVNKNDQK